MLVARNFGVHRTLQRALPIVDGTLAVAGIDAELEIVRDAHGVPHVWAKSERDAWFGLGFAQAQDRLAQMSFLVRAARGATAEVLGTEGLDADRLARTLGFGRLADAQLGAPRRRVAPHPRSPRRRRLRVDRGSAERARGEARRAGAPRSPARVVVPADSLAVAKLIAWGLDGSLDATLVLSDLIEKLGGFGARPFFPPEAIRDIAPRTPRYRSANLPIPPTHRKATKPPYPCSARRRPATSSS